MTEGGPRLYSYCLVCQSAHTQPIMASIQAMAPCRVISPRIIQRKWTKGKAEEKDHPFFPGYLFLYTEEKIPDFYRIRGILGVIRCLGAETGEYELSGEDLRFAEMLYSLDGVIGIQEAVQEGDQVRLVKGPFADVVGKILFMDRKKKRAKVQFTFDHTVYSLWVGVDILEKTSTDFCRKAEKAKKKLEDCASAD